MPRMRSDERLFVFLFGMFENQQTQDSLRQSPTVVTLAVIGAVFLAQQAVGVVTGPRSLFALSPPLFSRPGHSSPACTHMLACRISSRTPSEWRSPVSSSNAGRRRSDSTPSSSRPAHSPASRRSRLPALSARSFRDGQPRLRPRGQRRGVCALWLSACRKPPTDTVIGGFELAPRVQSARPAASPRRSRSRPRTPASRSSHTSPAFCGVPRRARPPVATDGLATDARDRDY